MSAASPTTSRQQQRAPHLRARIRRGMFTLLILTTAAWGVASFVEILGADGLSYLDLTQTARVLDPASCGWRSPSGPWPRGAAVIGDPTAAPPGRPRRRRRPRPSGLPRVAIVAPIYNEDTERVFAGLPGDVGGSARPAAAATGSIC